MKYVVSETVTLKPTQSAYFVKYVKYCMFHFTQNTVRNGSDNGPTSWTSTSKSVTRNGIDNHWNRLDKNVWELKYYLHKRGSMKYQVSETGLQATKRAFTTMQFSIIALAIPVS